MIRLFMINNSELLIAFAYFSEINYNYYDIITSQITKKWCQTLCKTKQVPKKQCSRTIAFKIQYLEKST